MVAGSSMSARIVVDNSTGHVVHAVGCLSLFQLALASSSYRPEPAWPACAQKFTIATGDSSYPVTLTASYDACGAGAGTPACLAGDPMPPLPAGEYRAVLFQSSHIGSAPASIPVRVTPRSLHPAAAAKGETIEPYRVLWHTEHMAVMIGACR
jgi:hypothetical protein